MGGCMCVCGVRKVEVISLIKMFFVVFVVVDSVIILLNNSVQTINLMICGIDRCIY